MKELSFIVVFTLLLNFVNVLKAQNCLQDFVEDVLHTSQVKNEKFYKKARRVVKSYSNDYYSNLKNLRVINIPEVFSTKEGERKRRNLSKQNLLCYIDGKSMVFDEALVVQDTTVLGAIFQSYHSALGLKFIPDVDSFRVQLAKTILKINPDIIFSIYNIPWCYWYIKDNQLYVLSYDKSSEMNHFKVYKASSYIKDYLKEDDIRLLGHKEVIIIAY